MDTGIAEHIVDGIPKREMVQNRSPSYWVKREEVTSKAHNVAEELVRGFTAIKIEKCVIKIQRHMAKRADGIVNEFKYGGEGLVKRVLYYCKTGCRRLSRRRLDGGKG